MLCIFKSPHILRFIIIISFFNVFAGLKGQTFILNEDFSSSEGTNPSAGWYNGAVVFEVRDGVYDEQIKLYEVSGASESNTITFRRENGDSSLVELHYMTNNPSNDFTLALQGTDYISFEDMSVMRTNGSNSILIQNGSHLQLKYFQIQLVKGWSFAPYYLRIRK